MEDISLGTALGDLLEGCIGEIRDKAKGHLSINRSLAMNRLVGKREIETKVLSEIN